MSTGGSRSRTETKNQVGTPARGQKVIKPASFGPTTRISPNSSNRGRANGPKGQ